ncbi:MAG: pyrroline-5-carboxylate reductase [Planctomycetota bacterium]|nr:pyrroline-5-carboxylate reductase [Planctomycetota bacterium]
MADLTLGFIGSGQMARALARGLVAAELTAGSKISFSDPIEAAASEFSALIPQAVQARSNLAVVQNSDVVFLAVKPQQMAGVLSEIAASANGKLVISIAAGIRLSKLTEGLPGARLVRVMPNTPCLVGQSASAFALGKNATPADGELVQRMLEAVGRAMQVEEKLLDAVTGLSGSGPAFVFVLIEALSDGGVKCGLSREAATTLAAQTVLGAAMMVLETKEHPAVLKDRVASPGGTTIAGLQVLENGGFRAALIGAVEAATRRSIELGS